MSLIREIQDDIAHTNGDTAAILRKCKILAARLKSDQLAKWVDHELDGYPESQPIPQYRNLTVMHFANFANSAWQFSRQPIPLRIVPEKYRDSFTSVQFGEGIAKAESLAKSKGNVSIYKPDLVPAIDKTLAGGARCQMVWAEIAPQEFEQLLSAVKSRILDFVLKLEAENPDAGEAPPNTEPIPSERLRPLVQNTFYGPVGAVAQNSEQFSQTTSIQVTSQEIAKLVSEFSSHLQELGLSKLERQRAEAQLAVLRAEATVNPDLGIIRQAVRTLRSITESAIGSLAAVAVTQPSVWHWIQQILNRF